MLVLDDAQWADTSTLELLLSLAADRQSPLRFAIGYRAVDVPPESALVRLVSGAGSGHAPVRVGLSTLGVPETRELVAIGLVSFAAVAQFAPALLGGLFWRGATRRGAVAGPCSAG